MHIATQAHSRPRFTGLGLVVLIHVLIVWALASGLVHDALLKAPPPPARLLKDDTPPPRPLEPLPTPKVALPNITPALIPPPAAPDTTSPPLSPAITSELATAMTSYDASFAPAVLPALPKAGSGPVNPGMVCTKMGKPELPPMSWSGEAAFRVVGTVKAGRVTGVDIQALRGSPDGKSRRALQSAISTALRDSYECPGDHVFEQEFNFRIE